MTVVASAGPINGSRPRLLGVRYPNRNGLALTRPRVVPRHRAREIASGTDGLRTLCGREMDSNFQYAGAVNLVVGPFGWVVLCDRVRVRARRFWDSAVSATQLGDLSRR